MVKVIHLPPPPTTSCPSLAAWSVRCQCHFDPGESGLIKPCLRMNKTCTSSSGCFYLRQQHPLPNGERTVVVQYGCSFPDPLGNCTEHNSSAFLHQCCFTDLCNRKFTSRLTSEMTDATTTPTPTSGEEGVRMMHSSTSLHVNVTPLYVCVQVHNHLLYI